MASSGLALAKGEITQQNGGAHALAVGPEGRIEMLARLGRPAVEYRARSQLAMEFGNRLLPQVVGMIGHGLGDLDGLQPLLFLLVDFEQRLERLLVASAAPQLEKYFFGAVEQPRLQVVQAEFRQGVQALAVAQAIAIDQILMHADRAVGFAPTPEQAAQGEVQFDGLRIDLGGLQEGFDGLVRLLVEEEVEALEIGARQSARFLQQMIEIDARGHPAEGKEDRQRQQPPKLDGHHRRAATTGVSGRIGRRIVRGAHPQAFDFAALPHQCHHGGGQANRRADAKRRQDDQRQRRLPDPIEVKAQIHRPAVLRRQTE